MNRWIAIRSENVSYVKRKTLFLVAGVFISFYLFVFLSMILRANTRKVFAYSGNRLQKEKLKAIRGSIYDRKMNIIAGNFYMAKVSMRRDVAERIGYDKFRALLSIFNKKISRNQYNRLVHSRHFVIKIAEIPYNEFFEKKGEETYLDKIASLYKSLDLDDVLIFDYEYKRFYSKDRFYSKFLAYMYRDTDGLKKIGLERTYDDILSGIDGIRTYLYNSKVGFYTEKRPIDGKSIVLTIDSSVQFVCQELVRDALKKYKADNIFVIVSRPSSGEILAMVSLSRKYGSLNSLIFRGAYEPGSTMKPIVGSIALDKGIVHVTDTFFCENGKFRLGKRIIKDHERFGNLTFREIIWHSSNIGMSKIALKIDNRTFYNSLKSFGFGKRTGLPFYKESRGIFPSFSEFSEQDKVSMSFGYGIGVTAVQMATALNTVVNGGYYVPPTIVKGVLGLHQTVQRVSMDLNRMGKRKVISYPTSSIMRQVLKGVVEHGTGRKAAIDGMSIGGKTGTSKKLRGKRYSNSYIASFYGFFPVRNPAISVYVVVDNPQCGKYYGGEVAAPLFKEIVLKIYPLIMEEMNNIEIPVPDSPVDDFNEPLFVKKTRDDPLGLKGLSMREAIQKLSLNGYDFICKGHGFVKDYRMLNNQKVQVIGNEL